MKVKIYSLKEFFFILFLFVANYSLGQQASCKVRLPAIAGAYSGECKNGLAHGNGIAQGIDHYEGQFHKGIPEGRGTYRWADGTYYEGQWKSGLREGKGKMVYRDSVVNGYWKDDKYMGEKLIAPFKITNSMSVSRSTITKSISSGNGVKIRILQGGSDNVSIEGFSLAYNSGQEYRMGNTYGLQNASFPLDVKITYRTWNQLHTSQYNVIFEFTIYDPGTWNVDITN